MTIRTLLLASGLLACCTCATAGLQGQVPPEAPVAWKDVLRQPEAWYFGAEARAAADHVLQFQRDSGGWPKNLDMTRAPTPAERHPDRPDATIDNQATFTQIRLLARVLAAAGDARYRDGALRGIDYLLAAQYPNGGWPQFFPLRTDYSRHITFNDGAMVGVLALLDDLSAGQQPWGFVDHGRRDKARAAVRRGVDVILRTQIAAGGTLTAWCAQHDEVTLEPRGARSYEHPSVSGLESVDIVRFLMRYDPERPAAATAIESAVAWFRSVSLRGWRLEERGDASLPGGFDRVLVEDVSAPPLWARFYAIGTNRPIFSGRDGIVRDRLADIEHERRVGYAWVGDWPRTLLEIDYPRWRARRGL